MTPVDGRIASGVVADALVALFADRLLTPKPEVVARAVACVGVTVDDLRAAQHRHDQGRAMTATSADAWITGLIRSARFADAPPAPQQPSKDMSWSDETKERVKREKAEAKAAGFRTSGEHRRHREAETHAENKRVIAKWMADAEAALDFADAFLNSTFDLSDGRTVTWGEATVGDHEDRIGVLTADSEHHQAIVRLLTKTQASCLNNVRSAA